MNHARSFLFPARWLILLALLAAPPLHAQEIEKDVLIWGAVVRGTNEAVAENAVKGELLKQLRAAFPWQNYEMLGEHYQEIFREYENWVDPSDELFMKIDSKGPVKGGGLSLHLQLWQKKNVLVKTDAVLRPGSPLFIRGPEWGEDRLLFVLELRKKTP